MTEIALINKRLWQLPYPAKARRTYAITIHSLFAMGWMALEQLQKVTAGISNLAELRALSRHTLVCDMGTIPQQIKWVQHIRRLTKFTVA